MAEPVKDGEGLAQDAVGGAPAGGQQKGVAEMVQDFGFQVAVADGPGEFQRGLVAGDGLLVVAQMMVGVADAVPGAGLAVTVAGFL